MEIPYRVQIVLSKPINPYGTAQFRCLQPADYLRECGYVVQVDQLYNTTPLSEG